MRLVVTIAIAPFWLLAQLFCANAAELITGFDQSMLDAKVWNDCQVDKPPLKFERQKNQDGTERTVLRVVIDGTTQNINDTCKDPATGLALDAAGEDTDLGGPSLVGSSRLEGLGAEECPSGGKAQRNELRLRQTPDLIHSQTEPHWYSITFRTDGNIPSCGSAQWILAQWKQEKHGDSPFLAQRFDNGILHVTVQNNHCRCVVAKADGDYEKFALTEGGQAEASVPQLKKANPIKCTQSDVDEEILCKPLGLDILTAAGTTPPSLPDPKLDWTTMTYLVRGGSDGKGQVDVYTNGRFVVRVKGLIGYETKDPGTVKFKFGHYRERLDSAASVSVDRICFSKEFQDCDPALQRVP